MRRTSTLIFMSLIIIASTSFYAIAKRDHAGLRPEVILRQTAKLSLPVEAQFKVSVEEILPNQMFELTAILTPSEPLKNVSIEWLTSSGVELVSEDNQGLPTHITPGGEYIIRAVFLNKSSVDEKVRLAIKSGISGNITSNEFHFQTQKQGEIELEAAAVLKRNQNYLMQSSQPVKSE